MSGTSSSISIGGTSLGVATPLADGVANTRAGAAGVSLNASAEDHIHPISRLAQVALPAVVVGGATLNGTTVWAQGTDEESQWYNIRVQITATAAGTWRTIVFPNLPGYQAPQVNLQGDMYVPSRLGPNAYTGQNFIWGNTTWYWNAPATYVGQTAYLNFTLRYTLA